MGIDNVKHTNILLNVLSAINIKSFSAEIKSETNGLY